MVVSTFIFCMPWKYHSGKNTLDSTLAYASTKTSQCALMNSKIVIRMAKTNVAASNSQPFASNTFAIKAP
ncbi:hypothetical protein D3C71_1974020 [compost metagenome]